MSHKRDLPKNDSKGEPRLEEILHHLGCIKPCKYWDKLPINWCRISSINSISTKNLDVETAKANACIFKSIQSPRGFPFLSRYVGSSAPPWNNSQKKRPEIFKLKLAASWSTGKGSRLLSRYHPPCHLPRLSQLDPPVGVF